MKKISIYSIILATILLGAFTSPEKIQAQEGDICTLLGGLVGFIPGLDDFADASCGGEAVRIVSDTSKTSIENTLSTQRIEEYTRRMAGNIEEFVDKEIRKDADVAEQAQMLQQKLTGEMYAYLNGTGPGQNGERPFVTNFSEHYRNIMQAVYEQTWEELSAKDGGEAGLCSPEQRFQVQEALANYWRNQLQEMTGDSDGHIFSCRENTDDPDEKKAIAKESAVDKLFKETVSCDGDAVCSGLKTQRILAERQANAIANERQALDYSLGMKPQRVCQGEGRSRRCEIVTPLYFAQANVVQQTITAPSARVTQADEEGEPIPQLPPQTANEVLTGRNWMDGNSTTSLSQFGGTQSIGGNPNYIGLTIDFGLGNILDYLIALINEAPPSDPGDMASIVDALNIETKRQSLYGYIATEVAAVDTKVREKREEFGSCVDYTLASAETNAQRLNQASSTANTHLSITNGTAGTPGTVALLSGILAEYQAATTSTSRENAYARFNQLKNLKLLGNYYDNVKLESDGIPDFNLARDLFRYTLAEKACSCGASTFDYVWPGETTPTYSCSSAPAAPGSGDDGG